MTLSKKAIINICICAVAVISLLLMFAPYVSISNEYVPGSDTVSGFQVAFGSDENYLGFTFAPFLVFLFFIAIAVLACLNAFVLKDNKVVTIVIMILAFASAVLLFLAGVNGLMWSYKEYNKEMYNEAKDYGAKFGPGFGAVLSAILMLAAGAGACANEFVLKD